MAAPAALVTPAVASASNIQVKVTLDASAFLASLERVRDSLIRWVDTNELAIAQAKGEWNRYQMVAAR